MVLRRPRPDEPLTAAEERNGRLASERLAFAVRHPTRHGTVELDLVSARVLLARVSQGTPETEDGVEGA